MSDSQSRSSQRPLAALALQEMALPLETDDAGRYKGAALDMIRSLYRTHHGTKTVLRQSLEKVPTNLYIDLLELGYSVAIGTDAQGLVLRFTPGKSIPRDSVFRGGGSGAHSVVCSNAGVVYSTASGDRVAMIDASTMRLIGDVHVGRNPQHLAISPSGDQVYSANFDSNNMSIINTASRAIIGNTDVGHGPTLPCVGGKLDAVWIPSRSDGNVTVMATDGTELAKIPVGIAPHDIGISPNGEWAYQPNAVSGDATIIDVSAMRAVGDIKLGSGPAHVSFTPDSSRAYITNTISNEVSVIRTDNHECVGQIVGGTGPHVPVVTRDGRTGCIANFVSNDITLFDVGTSTVRAVVPVGVYPHSMTPSPDSSVLVVSNTGESSVSLIDLNECRVRTTLTVGGAPGHITFDPEGRLAFVACEMDDTVAVVDVKKGVLVGQVPFTTPE